MNSEVSHIVIAVDGPAAAGKGTLSRLLAGLGLALAATGMNNSQAQGVDD